MATHNDPSVYTGKREWDIKQCPPHKWYWDDSGLLKCELCHQRPNYTSRDDNKNG